MDATNNAVRPGDPDWDDDWNNPYDDNVIDDRDEIDDMPHRLHYYAGHGGIQYAMRLGSLEPYDPDKIEPYLQMHCLEGDECTQEHVAPGTVRLMLISQEEYEVHAADMDKDNDD